MSDATTPAPTPGALVLTAPTPVKNVEPEQAAQAASNAIVLPPEKVSELDQTALTFVNTIATMDSKSPDFRKHISSISTMGAADIKKSSEVSNRMLDRPALRGGADTAQAKVGKTLGDLRSQITDLDPNRADLNGVKKFLKWLPGGNTVDNYFNRYRTAQDHLDAIVKALHSGKDELHKDNAAIEVERAAMWETMGRLQEYEVRATALDTALVSKIEQVRSAGNTEMATTLESDVLFAVRQRRQDIMTQMAVNVQGFLALDLVRKNNEELIRGVDRAETTTLSALRTAVIVSQALSQQKLVLDQITGLNQTTSNMIESTSIMLKQQGAQISEQAASSTIEVDKLKAAFQNVFDTMDTIDTFRAQANTSMAETIGALSGQVEQAQTYLERSAQGQLTEGAARQAIEAPAKSSTTSMQSGKMPWE